MGVFILTMTSKVLDKGLTRVSGHWYGSVNRQCSPGLLSLCPPLACDLSASTEKVLEILFLISFSALGRKIIIKD